MIEVMNRLRLIVRTVVVALGLSLMLLLALGSVSNASQQASSYVASAPAMVVSAVAPIAGHCLDHSCGPDRCCSGLTAGCFQLDIQSAASIEVPIDTGLARWQICRVQALVASPSQVERRPPRLDA